MDDTSDFDTTEKLVWFKKKIHSYVIADKRKMFWNHRYDCSLGLREEASSFFVCIAIGVLVVNTAASYGQ